MRVTIIKDDHKVVVDGVPLTVSCDDLPADFHALQWDGVRGEVEYKSTRCEHCSARSKKGNTLISDLSPYQPYVDAWHEAKATADAVKAAAAEKAKADAA